MHSSTMKKNSFNTHIGMKIVMIIVIISHIGTAYAEDLCTDL